MKLIISLIFILNTTEGFAAFQANPLSKFAGRYKMSDANRCLDSQVEILVSEPNGSNQLQGIYLDNEERGLDYFSSGFFRINEPTKSLDLNCQEISHKDVCKSVTISKKSKLSNDGQTLTSFSLKSTERPNGSFWVTTVIETLQLVEDQLFFRRYHINTLWKATVEDIENIVENKMRQKEFDIEDEKDCRLSRIQ